MVGKFRYSMHANLFPGIIIPLCCRNGLVLWQVSKAYPAGLFTRWRTNFVLTGSSRCQEPVNHVFDTYSKTLLSRHYCKSRFSSSLPKPNPLARESPSQFHWRFPASFLHTPRIDSNRSTRRTIKWPVLSLDDVRVYKESSTSGLAEDMKISVSSTR